MSIMRTNLSLGKYWWDWSGSHGDCGSVALLKNNELIMRSAPCMSTSNRFICEYSNFIKKKHLIIIQKCYFLRILCLKDLNPCYMNDLCGPRGKCVNLYYKFYCDCAGSFFWEGKYCEKCNPIRFFCLQTNNSSPF
jgi:hypothetical protein